MTILNGEGCVGRLLCNAFDCGLFAWWCALVGWVFWFLGFVILMVWVILMGI